MTTHKASYKVIAEDLKQKIESGAIAPGSRLPTEIELSGQYGVSRHTLRLALKQLVALGLIDQTQGRGTHVRGRPTLDGRYARSIMTFDDLTMWPGTDMEVLKPFETRVDPSIASRLQLQYVEVASAVAHRKFQGTVFVVTRHHVEPQLGKLLHENGIPRAGSGTVIGDAERFLLNPVAGVHQTISAIDADESIAAAIGAEPGNAVLLIERLYYDTAGAFVEFTESFFNPRLYTYAVTLQRRGKGS
ncbi:MAG: GntR family transcriptional regulator [Pigmentiphaga sp.]